MEPESVAKGLWRQAQAGDDAAREQLFSLHIDRLLIFIRARLGPGLRAVVEPEDVLQDAWVAALKSFPEFTYTDERAFLRWMCRIIDNRLRDAQDYFQARKRQPVPLPRSAPTGPSTAFRRSENREQIEKALAQLRPEHREVLLLRYFQGLSADEAADRMSRSPGAIRNLSARALVELGQQLNVKRESSS